MVLSLIGLLSYGDTPGDFDRFNGDAEWIEFDDRSEEFWLQTLMDNYTENADIDSSLQDIPFVADSPVNSEWVLYVKTDRCFGELTDWLYLS